MPTQALGAQDQEWTEKRCHAPEAVMPVAELIYGMVCARIERYSIQRYVKPNDQSNKTRE